MSADSAVRSIREEPGGCLGLFLSLRYIILWTVYIAGLPPYMNGTSVYITGSLRSAPRGLPHIISFPLYIPACSPHINGVSNYMAG